MSGFLLAVALMVGAATLAFPAPHAGLRRLSGADAATGRVAMLLSGKPQAPSLRSRVWLGGVVAGLLLLADPTPVGAALAAPAGTLVLVGSGWLWPSGRADPAVGMQLPGTLELLAACIEAGAPMQRAVETVAEVSSEPTVGLLEGVAGQLRLGRAEAEAWLQLREDPSWGPVARDVARSARSGTSLVDALRVHAEDQRRRLEAERAKAARAVGVRSVMPLMVCFLPAFVLVGVVPIVAGLMAGFLG
ncbi:type II secretion system F family protein [Tessaracoccus sp. OS52]|uniref:type II secretion system F family protein n=1 Tax=Tessaracoccus sp. OS52 TaxID=2886691 RepID=UPI001D10A003|nr:type II secretion system F family protein [Tessaracoccus sp. OS52]MCC2594384.1 type II secretion system F family protein [Tessaracoccus sp. OS52]